jgi:hypothetical protein
LSIQRLAGTQQVPCAASFGATNLSPSTAYQFSARNCDAITCSLWSKPIRVTTGKIDPNRGRVVLALDLQTQVGTAVISERGTFDATIVIPAGTALGNHRLRASGAEAQAQMTIAVTGVSPTGGKASITMVGILNGETGCPPHPINSTQTDASFLLFGAGFQPGAVSVRLDTVAGFEVGSAIAQADGRFCQSMRGVPSARAGNHVLMAVQNGVSQAQLAAAFVVASGPH